MRDFGRCFFAATPTKVGVHPSDAAIPTRMDTCMKVELRGSVEKRPEPVGYLL